jgi:hypothetical protein
MKRIYLTAKGLLVNGIVFLVNVAVFLGVYSVSGKDHAVAFAYGAFLAQMLSLSWFLVSAPFMTGPYFIAAALGGFLFRAVILIVFFFIGLRVFDLSVITTAVSFLLVRSVLITAEIIVGFRMAKMGR